MDIADGQGTILIKNVECATTTRSQARGLMFRKQLSEQGGLLFVFKRSDIYGIWMLFMRFPIDIVFLDKEKKIVDVVQNAPPLSLRWNTWRIYKPKEPAMYILEVNAGFCEKKKLHVGDQLQFTSA